MCTVGAQTVPQGKPAAHETWKCKFCQVLPGSLQKALNSNYYENITVFSSEIENSTETEPFHRSSPAKKPQTSYKNISMEEGASLKNFHIIIT